jgi:arylsulfatase A-like enzyme
MPPWRQAILVENAQKGSEQRQSPAPHQAPRYRALRTADLLYVEYVAGERELYDRRADPYELDNLAGETDPAFLERLSRRLADLAECAAAGCHATEDAPLDWPAS